MHKDKITNIKERPWMKKMMVTMAQATIQMMIGMKMLKQFIFQQPQLDSSAERLVIQVIEKTYTSYSFEILYILGRFINTDIPIALSFRKQTNK